MHSFAVLRKPLAVMLFFGALGAGRALGAVITEQVTVPPQTVIAATGVDPTDATVTFTSSFGQFDPALGTLTGVTFDYDYEFQIVMAGTAGGSGGSAAGPVEINGAASSLVIAGGSGGAGPGTVPFSETGSYSPTGDLSSYIGAGAGSFAWQADEDVSPGGTPDFTAELDLVAPSSLTVTYTYTAPVPEPAALGLGIGSLFLLCRRARRSRA